MDYINNGTMVEQITSLYESVNKIIDQNCKLNLLSMTSMQAMNYNGFKRWHRYRARQFHELKICLANEMYDKFRIKPEMKFWDLAYDPSDIEEHLKSWNSMLLESIKHLGELNKTYFELTGITSGIIEKSIYKMTRDYEKVGRYLRRFSDSNWSAIDISNVDDMIHCKYKEKENELGFKY